MPIVDRAVVIVSIDKDSGFIHNSGIPGYQHLSNSIQQPLLIQVRKFLGNAQKLIFIDRLSDGVNIGA